ncbi:MAG: hypothetical protein GY701_11520 [Sulfitobacter sp.]|nr:hypothetical protein [Sulfitobacter sp.]
MNRPGFGDCPDVPIGVIRAISRYRVPTKLWQLHPTNGRADEQLRRNRATQYFSYPDWKFDRPREEVPGHYEAYVDLVTGAWTGMRIEVEGERALLFVHDQPEPTLVVNDLKHGPDLEGGVGLYIDNGTEGFFRNLSVRA